MSSFTPIDDRLAVTYYCKPCDAKKPSKMTIIEERVKRIEDYIEELDRFFKGLHKNVPKIMGPEG